ncbi:MAG: VCBS repeat-containing protein [Myxococcota bacterium]|nr:VCBS repeat-containing protein [Myxococcota bacterium]
MTPLLLLLVGCGPDTTNIIEVIVDACCCCEDDCDTGDTHNIDTGDTGDTGVTGTPPCADFSAPDASRDVATIDDCEAEPDPIEFIPEVEWTWAPTDADHPFNQVMVTPVTGNLTDDNGDGIIDTDDTPDVVFTAFEGSNYRDHDGALVIVSGDDGTELYYHTSFTHNGVIYTPQSQGGMALGDINNDGIPEICLPTDQTPLLCTHADGNVIFSATWTSSIPRTEWVSGFPVIGDMDGDGNPEIAIGRVIWDNTGAMIGVGTSSHGGYTTNGVDFYSNSVMSDVDGDGDLELIAGDVAYEMDGSQLWSNSSTENGFSAVGDLNLDGSPDVVTTGTGTAYILDGAGNVSTSFALVNCASGSTCGSPTIADFDADGEPEIGIAGVSSYTVYDDNQTGTWSALWSETINDASGGTGAVVFDFEADGEAEVVFADEDRMYIWGGSDGTDRLGLAGWDPTDHSSGTGVESPILADIDNDGSTEIVLGSNELFTSGWFGVRSLGSGSGPAWAPSRPVWNQHSYHITNINDDLSVPAAEEKNWGTFNNFRTQDQGDRPGNWLPDLFLSYVDYCADCDAEKATFYVVVDNQGLNASMDVDLVFSDTVNGELSRDTITGLQPQESQVFGPYLISTDDWAGALEVRIDEAGIEAECDESNNALDVGELICD